MGRTNDSRFKELVLHVAERSADDASFGATKLNKILFYSDFLAYGYFGESITGQEYFRLPHGPAPRYLLPVQQDMERAGDIVMQEVNRYAYRQKRVIPLRPARLGLFTSEQLELVQEVIDALQTHSAVQVSELSHDFLGWELVQDGETIPYNTVFLSREAPDQEHIEKWTRMAHEHGWVESELVA